MIEEKYCNFYLQVKKSIFWILICLLMPSVAAGQQSIQPLLEKLDSIIIEEDIPGAMISIVRSDSIIFAGGVGYANIEKKEPVSAEHLFRLGSISKSFTAIGIMKLVEAGKLQLNTPIKEIDSSIPIKNNWVNENPITLENILEHTAGFDDMHLHAIFNTTDSTTPPAFQMVQTHKNSLYARWKPGTRMAYSNPGYVLAGHVLEKISGKDYTTYLKNEVLKPLGMHASGFYFKSPKHSIAQGYTNSNTEQVFTSIQGGPAGEFCSNAKEMALYLQYMLNKKLSGDSTLLLSEESFDRIENATTTLAAKNGLPGGYGLGNYTSYSKGFLFNGHSGGIDGFSSTSLYNRTANLGIAISINKQASTRNLRQAILDYFIEENSENNSSRTIEPISEEMIKNFNGFYEYKSPRNQLQAFIGNMIDCDYFKFSNDIVIVRNLFGKTMDTLYHAGNNLFYSGNETVPFAVFFKNEDGKTAIDLGGSYGEKASLLWRWIKNSCIWLSAFLILPYFLYGLIWFIGQLFSQEKKEIRSRLILWLATLSFLVMAISFIASVESMDDINSTNPLNWLFFISSVFFFVFAILSVLQSLQLNTKELFFNFYYRVTSVGVMTLALYLLYHGLIGLKLWAY